MIQPSRARASNGPWMLLAWLILPSLAAVWLAMLCVSLISPPLGLAVPRMPVKTAHLPTDPTPTLAVLLSTSTAVPVVQAPPADIPTPDQQALALLTELPAVLPPGFTDAASASPTAPPTVAPPTDPPTAVPPIPTNHPTSVPPTPPPPTEVAAPSSGPADPITGLPADPALIARAPLVVMIDNHPDAAPQTGLNSASMVIEALAEGGITRFESFFLTGDAPTVGPVRSARPYFVEWAYPFKPLYTHCGGSWEAIDLLREAGANLTNVDCFDGNMPFWRSSDRLMPHNLYSSTTQLWKVAARQGLAAPANEPSFLHSAPAPPDARPASASLSFYFSDLSRSDVTWVYDRASDSYLRKQWGYWHRDLASGDIVSAANVVVLWTNVWELPGDEKGRMGTDTIGAGTALIMRDGQFEWGYWARKDVYSVLNLFDGKHQPMRLAPGRLWIEALAVGRKVEIGK
ncbi:MAG: DUF3048 domain-containing protein [Chloroflexia bacterium]